MAVTELGYKTGTLHIENKPFTWINTTGTSTGIYPVSVPSSYTTPSRYYTDYGSFSIYKLPDLETPFLYMMNVYAAQALEKAWSTSVEDQDTSFVVFENITGVIMGIFKNGGTLAVGYARIWLEETHREYVNS